jgi:hypothetical protein
LEVKYGQIIKINIQGIIDKVTEDKNFIDFLDN